MPIAPMSMGKEFDKPSYDPTSTGAGPSGIDPNLLRLLAERKRKQGLSAPSASPGQQAPAPPQGFRVQGAPIDPRLRAAMMLRQKLRDRQMQGVAPTYGQVAPRKV